MRNKMLISRVSSRGQVTIPAEVRKVLHIGEKGDMIGFDIREDGVLMKRLIVTEPEEDFSEEEWEKLEKLANKKGKLYTNAKDFLASLEEL